MGLAGCIQSKTGYNLSKLFVLNSLKQLINNNNSSAERLLHPPINILE